MGYVTISKFYNFSFEDRTLCRCNCNFILAAISSLYHVFEINCDVNIIRIQDVFKPSYCIKIE